MHLIARNLQSKIIPSVKQLTTEYDQKCIEKFKIKNVKDELKKFEKKPQDQPEVQKIDEKTFLTALLMKAEQNDYKFDVEKFNDQFMSKIEEEPLSSHQRNETTEV